MQISDYANQPMSRRGFVGAAVAVTAGVGSALVAAPVQGATDDASLNSDPFGYFPSLDPDLARQVVQFSHGKIDQLKALVERRPELALAAIDWGFGDWESALGAAAHMGRRDIAELLLAHGARTNLFTAAMLGQLEVVQAAVGANPGIQRLLGPHGFSLLHHARAGKEQAQMVVEFLESLGDADSKYTNEPLSETQIASIAGEYSYGNGPTQRFTIEQKRGNMRLGREGSFPRTLFHQGNLEFHPGGAPSVRIAFSVKTDAATKVSLNISDPPLIARRLG